MTDMNEDFQYNPLEKIEYESVFPLLAFIQKKKLGDKKPHIKKALVIVYELKDQYYDICLTLNRINEHIESWNLESEAFKKMISGQDSKKIRESFDEAKERNLKDYMNLDVRIYFILMNTFMDRVPLLIKSYFKSESLPAHKSYDRFLKSLKKLSGNELDKVKNIVVSTEDWFPHIKDIRDKFTIHNYSTRGISTATAGVPSTTLTRKMEKGGIFILQIDTPNLELIFDRLHFFLKQLNEYLIKNAELAPFTDTVKM